MARCMRDPRRATAAPITNCELFSALSIPQYRLRPYALARAEVNGMRVDETCELIRHYHSDQPEMQMGPTLPRTLNPASHG
jgi:hypothetical protein